LGISGSGWVRGAVTVSPDGIVYFGDTRAYVYALNGVTGSLTWKRQAGASDIFGQALQGALVFRCCLA